jgi:hypothetical protein
VAVDGQHECRVRFRRGEDGHLAITDVHVHGAGITPGMLRGIPLARIEAEVSLGVNGFYVADQDFSATLGESLAELPEGWAAALRSRQAAERPRLSRPTGAFPEDFYARVADAYAEYASRTKAPAKALADEAGVPVTTAHRWVREARRLGCLPPGRKGKAG